MSSNLSHLDSFDRPWGDFNPGKDNHLEKEIFQVFKILDDRVENGEKRYLIRWDYTEDFRKQCVGLAYGKHLFSWDPVSNLDCPDIIEAYEKAKKDKTTQKKEKEEVKQEVKQEAKHEVKKEVKETKQWLLKRKNPKRKKKTKKVFQHYWYPIFTIFRLSQMDGNEVSPPKKSLVLNNTDRAY